MSINSGLFAGVAAVAAQSTAFAVISDNIANVNTVGYKETDARFRTLVTRSPSTTSFTAGGVVASPLSDPQQQGLLQGTTSSTDISIDGNGFFITNEAEVPGANDEFFLTRAGSFVANENGRLTNTAGYFLQGYLTDTSGNIVNNTTRDLLSSLETINLAQFGQIANPTTSSTINVNLPSNATLGAVQTTNITVFDSEGNDYLLRLGFDRDAANSWLYSAVLADPAGIIPSITLAAGAPINMDFNADGTLNVVGAVTGATGAPALSTLSFGAARILAEYGRGVNNLTITVNFGTFDQPTGTTQFDSDFAPSLLNQDGSAPSALTSVSIADDGLLTAQFANGQARSIYRLPVGTIPSPTQLEAVSGNAYRVTATSGDVVLNIPQTGSAGRIQASSLENSTVDIAEEFTDLIITQRAYSAATKIITTGDELLDEIIRVKR